MVFYDQSLIEDEKEKIDIFDKMIKHRLCLFNLKTMTPLYIDELEVEDPRMLKSI